MMTSGGVGDQEVDWEVLFKKEALAHIHKLIAAMEDEIYGEFKIKLGYNITMSNYWRLKFILAKSMSERESFGECMNLTINTFKEDVEKELIHMKRLMQLSDPPFNRENKDYKDVSTNNALEDEVESSRRF